MAKVGEWNVWILDIGTINISVVEYYFNDIFSCNKQEKQR